MNSSYYILTNLLSDEDNQIIRSIISHIENGDRKLGIQQVASENFVSPTFIMRMCKRLGFDGYSELFYDLSRQVGDVDKVPRTENLRDLIDNYSTKMERTFCEYLSEVQEKKIFIIGNGFSSLVADYFVQRLAVCGFMVFNSVHFYDFMVFNEKVRGMSTNVDPSLIIAISQSGESESVVNDVKSARQNGYKVVSFTKREHSTLAELSDLTFIVDGAKQTLIGGIPNPFFGRAILAFEELVSSYFGYVSQKQAELSHE